MIFITGSAGFIGSVLAQKLMESGSKHIVGIDSMNDYYDVSLKEYRLSEIEKVAVEHPDSKWTFINGNIADKALIEDVFTTQKAPEKKTGEDGLPVPPYAVYNIGNSNPENLLEFVTILQEELIRAKVLPEDYDFDSHKKLVPMQAGDVPITYADTSALERDFGFKPSTSIRTGLRNFAEWYKEYYKV